MKIVVHNWGYGQVKMGDIVRICWKFSECIKDYHSLHSASVFTLSPVNNTRGHSATIQKNHCSLNMKWHFLWESLNRWNSLSQHVIDSASINVVWYHKKVNKSLSNTNTPASITRVHETGSATDITNLRSVSKERTLKNNYAETAQWVKRKMCVMQQSHWWQLAFMWNLWWLWLVPC